MRLPGRSDALERQRDALAAADAHGHQRALAAGALKLVERLDRQDRAGGAARVAEAKEGADGPGLGDTWGILPDLVLIDGG